MVYPNIKKSCIAENVIFGKNVNIVEPINLYGCSIEDDCFIGPFVEIQKNVIIGKRTRIQSHVFICSYVTIGIDCFISHGVMFINDLFKDGKRAKGDINKYKETIIGNNVSIGSNSTILPVNIVDNVCIGAGSLVTKDLLIPGIYYGSPAKLHKEL
jgi:acetyltransferase-like isoleucine patch superfamily enzyme